MNCDTIANIFVVKLYFAIVMTLVLATSLPTLLIILNF